MPSARTHLSREEAAGAQLERREGRGAPVGGVEGGCGLPTPAPSQALADWNPAALRLSCHRPLPAALKDSVITRIQETNQESCFRFFCFFFLGGGSVRRLASSPGASPSTCILQAGVRCLWAEPAPPPPGPSVPPGPGPCQVNLNLPRRYVN